MTIYSHTTGGAFNVGNKEDWSEEIMDISPTKTPLFGMFGEETADSVLFETYSEDLRAVDPSNDRAVAQGGTPSKVDEDRIPMQNYTQIYASGVEVTDTQQATKKVGINDELGHRGARELAALKQDYEARILCGVGMRSPRGGATASLMQGMVGIIARYADECNSGTNYGANNTVNVCITQENFDDSGALGAKNKLTDLWQDLFILGSGADTLVMGAEDAKYLGRWSAADVTRMSNEVVKITDNVELFATPFGMVKRIIHRTLIKYSDNGVDSFDGVTGEAVRDFAYLITPSLWKRMPLKDYNWQSEDLARSGPLKDERQFKYQGALRCKNPGGELVYNFAGWATHNHTLALPTTAAGYITAP